MKPASRYTWWLVGLLWLAAALNSADRTVLAAVMPALRADFGLSDGQLGLINAIFFWTYAAGAFVFGRIGDSAPRSRVIVAGLAVWSVATGATSLSTGLAMLIAIRATVALGEAPYFPAATALIGDWQPRERHSRSLALHQTGVFVGAGLGALAAGFLADWLNWKAPFVIFSAIGLAWAAVLAAILRDVPSEPRLRARLGEPYAMVLRSPRALALCAVFFLSTGAATALAVWAPTYVHDALGLTLAGSALYGAGPVNLAGLIAVPIGGALGDWALRKGPNARFGALAGALLLAGLLLVPLPLMTTAGGIAGVLLASTIGKGLFDGGVYAAALDLFPPHSRATAIGVMTTCGYAGGGLMPLLVGLSSHVFGLGGALAALAGLYFLAAALLFFVTIRAKGGLKH